MTDEPEKYEGCDCGSEHRTLGGRAWCFDCHEYCYPDAICEIQHLRNENDRLTVALGAAHDLLDADARGTALEVLKRALAGESVVE